MTFSYKSFSIPRAGNTAEENEDFFQVEDTHGRARANPVLRCAISDGATSTGFSRLWASCLVKHASKYVPSKFRLQKTILPEAQKDRGDKLSQMNLPWNAEAKAKLGSFATLLWLSIKKYPDSSPPTYKWKALAIGDTNLLHLRGGDCIFAFPIKDSIGFSGDPYLLSSLPERNRQLWSNVHQTERECNSGDDFLLATDALACFLLKQHEANRNLQALLHDRLGDDPNPSAFEDWIQSLRSEGCIKNDDTTLIWIHIAQQLSMPGI